MKTLTELIQNYQNGIPDSDSEILKRMEPLVKGYASRIHCMEREVFSCGINMEILSVFLLRWDAAWDADSVHLP